MSVEYELYLERHRANVYKGFVWIQENLPEVLADEDIEWQIKFDHDSSKNEPDEYEAYDRYFYGNNISYQVVQDFKQAWLLHIHRNPHHWQHWVLINDEPEEGEIVLEMPYNYILEMVCDWWAFSWEKGDLTEIFKWYNEHRDYMKLHPNTRKNVEDILSQIHDKLENSDTELVHHGVKGQKRCVRNGPPYPLNREKESIEKSEKSGIVRKKVSGHRGLSPRGIPNSIADHVDRNDNVDKRAFYNENGMKNMEIHMTDHGNRKEHPYGDHGEHVHYYEWDYETNRRVKDEKEEIPEKLRKENGDIL